MKKELIKILIKVLIYALTLIGSYLGISAMCSCSVYRAFEHRGTGYFQYYDTLHVHGNSSVVYPKN